MDRNLLEELLAQGLSLAAIGRRLGKHESTVAYWMDAYGLRAVGAEVHAARGGLDHEELERMVSDGLTIAEISESVGRSKGTVRYWLNRYGLRTGRGRGRRSRAGADEAREAGVEVASLECPTHGAALHRRDTRGYYRCLRCRQQAVVLRRRKVKAQLVADAGGGCLLCGYCGSLEALQFHHLDPSTKQFGIAQYGHARSLERMRAEALKCVLLCSNCHAEVEAGVADVSGIAQTGDPG